MRLRPLVLMTLVRKDVARLVRNGPALMMLGLLVLVAVLVASSGLTEDSSESSTAGANQGESWIVYWEDDPWVQFLKQRAPEELDLRFVAASELESEGYPANAKVIELRPAVFDSSMNGLRPHIRYRYPGTDPNVLWPMTRWFLAHSVVYFGQVPLFFDTIEPLTSPTQADQTRAALERVSIADVLNPSLIGTALLTAIHFFAACGLLVSLTAQERERGALRALLLTPATYIELVGAKAIVHIGLALGASTLAMAALQPAVFTSVAYWATMVAMACGYFSVGLLIAAFARNQAAPNLLSFAYLLVIGTLNLLGHRFEAFHFLSQLTFERYGLILTVVCLNQAETGLTSLTILVSQQFRLLLLLAAGLLLISTFIGSRTMTRG